MKMTVFWDIVPCSLVEFNVSEVHDCIHHQDQDAFKMEAASSSEMLVTFYQIT
jgi:hypothetical protein